MRIFKIIFSLMLIQFAMAEDLPLTKSNLQGQKKLFTEGWFIITSPVEALKEASLNGETSHSAFRRALQKARDKDDYPDLKTRLDEALRTMHELKLTARSGQHGMSEKGSELRKDMADFSDKSFAAAWEKINLGYLQYFQTNESDLEELKKINTLFFKRNAEGLQTFEEILLSMKNYLVERNEIEWKKYFKEGQLLFEAQYEKSGTKGNSLSGLWEIMVGYAQFAYSSVVKPSGSAVVKTSKQAVYYSTSAFLNTIVFSHNTFYSLGANVYYATKLGLKVISPTLEAGYLAGLSLASALAAPVTAGTFKTVGLINRVAVTSVAPLVGTTEFVLSNGSDVTRRALTYLVHGSEGVGEVVFEKIESGVTLGYSALSQIPPQLLLTAINSIILLVYEGPKLVLMKVKGKIGGNDIGAVPAGSIMNMDKLKENGLEVEVLTEDNNVIQNVLKNSK